MLTWICLSDAYNLSHVAPKEIADPKFDAYFAHMPLKALSPEVLYESLQTATRSDETTTLSGKKSLKAEWTAKLVTTFGDDEGNEVTFNGTMIQALMMMNGRELNSQVGKVDTSSVVRRAITRHGRFEGVMDELFLTTLGRHPTPVEMDKIKATSRGGIVTESKPASEKPQRRRRRKVGEKPRSWRNRAREESAEKSGEKVAEKTAEKPQSAPPTKKPPTPIPVAGFGPANDAVAFYQDVFWALLNTAEFMLNH